MYRHSPYDRDDGGWVAWLSITLFFVMAFIYYIISVLGTHLLLHYLNRYILDGKLDEDDNLVLLWSAIVWALFGPLLLFLEALEAGLPTFQHELEILVWLLGSAAISGGYGLLVGLGVVWWLWYRQVDRTQDGLVPAGHVAISSHNGAEAEPNDPSTQGPSDGAEPVSLEWYKEGVVLGEEV